jgi:voltage-gated potassium channel
MQAANRAPVTETERFFSAAIRVLILYSVAMYLLEVEVFHSPHSRAGHPFFLWSERFVAAVFTIEYLWRWHRSRRARYPLTLPAAVDLIAVAPFWLGFFVQPEWLRWVRALRILRLFRLFYYDPDMRTYARAMRRAWPYAKSAIKVMAVLLLTYIAIMYEMERPAQPEKFASLRDTWYFAVTTLMTVGYGDVTPVTVGGRMVTTVVMILGGAVVASFFAVITTAFVNEILGSEPQNK